MDVDKAITVDERIEKHSVCSVIIDGLDGSGKGELTSRISAKLEQEGYTPIVIDYPRYHLQSGIAIKKELRNPQMDIYSRLSLYALNRLESILEIYSAVQKAVSEGRKPALIFDRFTTSNLITLAYELVKMNPNYVDLSAEEIANLEVKIAGVSVPFSLLFQMILNHENQFLSYLGLQNNFKVIIPEISADITIQRMDGDATRGDGTNNRDAYEQLPVQRLSAKVYRAAEILAPGNFIFIQQNERTPDEIAEEILKKIEIDQMGHEEQITKILSIDIEKLKEEVEEWKIELQVPLEPDIV